MSRETAALIIGSGLAILFFILQETVSNLPSWLATVGYFMSGGFILGGIIAFLHAGRKHKIKSEFSRQQISQTGNDSTAVQIGQVDGNVTITKESHRDSVQEVKVVIHEAYRDECYCIKVTNICHEDVEITNIWFAGHPEKEIIQPHNPLPRRLKPNEPAEWLVPVSDIPADPDVFSKFWVQLSNGSKFHSVQNFDFRSEGFVSNHVSDQTKNIVTGIICPPQEAPQPDSDGLKDNENENNRQS